MDEYEEAQRIGRQLGQAMAREMHKPQTVAELWEKIKDPRFSDEPVLVRLVEVGKRGPGGAWVAHEYPVIGGLTGWSGDGVSKGPHATILAECLPFPLNFSEVRDANVSRERRWHEDDKAEEWTGADWGTALGGECGEALNVVKKLRRKETGLVVPGDPTEAELKTELSNEIADVFIYLDLLAEHYGIDIESAVRNKFNAVSERRGFPERI